MQEVLTRRFQAPLEGRPRRRVRHMARPYADRRRAGEVLRWRAIMAELGRWRDIPMIASPRAWTATRPARRNSTAPASGPWRCGGADPVLYFIQRLRDRAHRFALGHPPRRQRAKARERQSAGRTFAGVGATRKRAASGRISARPRRSVAPNLADLRAVDGQVPRGWRKKSTPIFTTLGLGPGVPPFPVLLCSEKPPAAARQEMSSDPDADARQVFAGEIAPHLDHRRTSTSGLRGAVVAQ